MTIREAIAYADALFDNQAEERLKCRFAAECEARVWTGVMQREAEDSPVYRWEWDADRELLLPPPYNELYPAYLLWKLALYHHEDARAEQARTLYNRLYDQTAIWYAKTYDPAHGGSMAIREVPTVVQGETVTVAFSLPVEAETLSALQAVVSAGGEPVYEAALDQMETDGAEARFSIPQEQSLALPVGILRVAVAGLTAEGQRFEAWPPLELRVVETGVREVLA